MENDNTNPEQEQDEEISDEVKKKLHYGEGPIFELSDLAKEFTRRIAGFGNGFGITIRLQGICTRLGCSREQAIDILEELKRAKLLDYTRDASDIIDISEDWRAMDFDFSQHSKASSQALKPCGVVAYGPDGFACCYRLEPGWSISRLVAGLKREKYKRLSPCPCGAAG